MKVTYQLRTSECMSSHKSKWRNSKHTFLITHLVLKHQPNMKVTYPLLITSECMSSNSSKWRKEQPYILNNTSCVRISTKYQPNMKVTGWAQVNAWVHTAESGKNKSNHTLLITHLVRKLKVTYSLSTSL